MIKVNDNLNPIGVYDENMCDSLTGLPKYEYFVDNLRRIIEQQGDNENFKLAIVYSDFRHFKYLNETFGYSHGNKLLKMYADFAYSTNPIYLGCSRVYSDNFVMAVDVSNFPSPNSFYVQVDKKNLAFERKIKGMFFDSQIMLNTGVYILKNAFTEDLETAISNANYARKEAKKFNTDLCVYFDDSMMKSLIMKMELTATLPKAIETKELKAFYQPKIDCLTGKVIGAEALIRWIKEDGSYIYPDQFIPFFESNGLIVDVDYYVYKEVFEYIRHRIDNELPVIPISMNVSKVHFQNDDIILYIEELLEEYCIPTEYLEFELTESLYINNIEKVLSFVKYMHSLGIKISMDDFGSGYSSLNLLSTLPIDILKLDKVFLSSNNLSNNQKIIISSIISMAKLLNIKVICEGVEYKEQSKFLAESGCDMFQGYYFSRPINEADFDIYLSKAVF
jgi:EAL domain-containing protein (putative c-di-GMP-specific phosphodiesterase class I)/GGDEF domain-containing protein